MASDLISKLLAAGLSAGLFLIWWPEHHATAGLASLIVRGALWTLTFELLLLAFAPLERLARRAISARAHRLRARNPFSAVPGPARVGGACVLACAGAALPLTLLAGAQGPRPAHAATTKRVVIVRRPVVKRVVVRETVTLPAAAAHPSPPVIVRAAAATRTPARKTTRSRPSVRRGTPAAPTKRTTPTAAAPTTPATGTTTAPAATAPAAAPAAAQPEATPAG